MAASRVIHRDRYGRFRQAPPPKIEPNPLNFPTRSHPRFRLRVFDRAWPWRATRGEAMDDALASDNASYDSGRTWLTVPADIEQDPAPRLPWTATVADYARLHREEERNRCQRTSAQRR